MVEKRCKMLVMLLSFAECKQCTVGLIMMCDVSKKLREICVTFLALSLYSRNWAKNYIQHTLYEANRVIIEKP